MSCHPQALSILALDSLAASGVALHGISADSRQIKPGMVFAAYPGASGDGRQYIPAAIAAGAAAVLWETTGFVWEYPQQIPNAGVCNLKAQIGNIAAHLYAYPSADLWTIGVTGTNGKTSCSQWIAQSLSAMSRKTAVMGTLGNGFLPELSPTGNTTADATVLQSALADYKAAGAWAVTLEVSSHGLAQERVQGVEFDVAVLTNLSRDHLDYHGDMERYKAAKARLFSWPGLQFAVLNQDDAFGRELDKQLANNTVQVVNYGLQQGNVRGTQLEILADGISMTIESDWGRAKLRASVLGRFNAYNLLACLSTLLVSGIKLDDAVEELTTVQSVSGRMQVLGGDKMPLVVVDYAHTPDALEQALMSIREHSQSANVWCVFGCGGDRDTGKRELMGAVASRLADKVIVTSDNPRSENAHEIIAQIRAGMNGSEIVIADRGQAIQYAVTHAALTDIVLIAGKGHEEYQEVAGVKLPFSDLQAAHCALETRTWP